MCIAFAEAQGTEQTKMKQIIKGVLSRIPGALSAVEALAQRYRYTKLKMTKPEDVFRGIYRSNAWGDSNSVSGPGSNLVETRAIREAIPRLLFEHGVSSLLDIPCGDFFWMDHVGLGTVKYIGGDIVEEIVKNNRKYQNASISFERMDILQSLLPTVDLVLVRDCLVHFSYEGVFEALRNICRSRSGLLLTTTFPMREANEDIATGQWRPLNLQKPPFCFPEPELLVNEQHPQEEWADKALGLWVVEDLEKRLGA